MQDDPDSGGLLSLDSLERYLQWENRTLCLAVFGIVIFAAEGEPDKVDGFGFKCLEYAVMSCFLMDSYFSVVITAIFLRPISIVLRDGHGHRNARQSSGFKQLQKTKYMTLFGCSLAVLSSTLLYMNLLFFFDGKTTVVRNNKWLNPLIVGKFARAGTLNLTLDLTQLPHSTTT